MRYERPIGQSTFGVRVLPARAGYLTRPDDAGGVVDAIREASTRWAGYSEPIIPVPVSGVVDAWWCEMLELADVDGLVNVNLDPDVAETATNMLGLPVVDLADIDKSGRTQFSTHPANLQHTQPEFSSQAAVLARADGDLWERAAAGDLTADHEADCASASVRVRRPRTADEVARAQLSGTCLLDMGTAHFAEYIMEPGPMSAPTVIWVTEPNSIEDCVYFWNLRALRSRRFRPAPMLLIPARATFHWTGFADAIAYRLARPTVIEPDVVLRSASVEPEELDEIASLLGLVRSTRPARSGMSFSPPPPKRAPFTYRTDIDPSIYFRFPRRYGETSHALVQVYRDSTVVEVESPVQFTGGGHVLVRLSSSAFDGLPKRPTTASLVMKDTSWPEDELVADVSWSEDELEFATSAQNRYHFELRAPTLPEATWALLDNQTVEAELSDKGRLASGLDELGGAEVLLQESVIEVIYRLQTPRSTSLLRELRQRLPEDYPPERLEQLASDIGGRATRRYRPLSNIKCAGPNAGEAAELLCSRSWAERGLATKCGRCGIGSFVPLSQTRPEPRCPACGATHTSFAPANSPELYYRLNALVDRAADQGVIPHLFAAAVLTNQDPGTFLLPGIDLILPDGAKREVDLYGITGGKIVAGEAKTNPAWFNPKQLVRDIELSALLAADTHLVVSTGRVSEDTEDQARQLAEARDLDLRVLDSRHRKP